MPENMMTHCPSCNGEGRAYEETTTATCEMCEGLGELAEVPCDICDSEGCPRCLEEGWIYNALCPLCEGLGEQDYHPKCSTCGGTGWVPNFDLLEVE